MSRRISSTTERLLFAGAVLLTPLGAASQSSNVDWPAYHGGVDNAHYSSLSQINRSNVQDLEVAWTLDTGDALPGREMYCNPLVVDGVIYLLSPQLDVIAADAATGDVIWRFDPSEGRRLMGRYRVRGLSFRADGDDARLFVGIRHYLYALDARTGKPATGFGDDGKIDLREHLDRDPAHLDVQLSTPGVVFEDLVIVGSTVSEFLPSAYGDIRAYDVRTGELRWAFHTIPRPGEFGHDTWPEDAWRHTGGANSWAGLTLDETRGIVFVPTGSAAFDYYGGDRHGENLFANTLLALDARTGERLWHFQVVRHDTWDRDLPTAPTLVSVRRGERLIDAVAQPTKSGHLFVLDRKTGESLFPLQEIDVPVSGLPGERLAPKQVLPVLPLPFSRQKLDESQLHERTSEAFSALREQFERYTSGGQFTPQSTSGIIMQPGLDGGAEWGGAAWDPESRILYVNANDVPWILRVGERSAERPSVNGRDTYTRECSVCHGDDRRGHDDNPALTELDSYHTLREVVQFVAHGSGRMPGFRWLGADALYAVAEYAMTGSETRIQENQVTDAAPDRLRYTLAEAKRFQDPGGFPAITPPWGTLNAIDLDTGEYVWRVPLGEYPELPSKGMPPTGSENYGGAIVTKGGLVFIAATIFDKKFRAFDKLTGKVLWESKLPAAGHSTPATYLVDGRQFVVIAAGGGKATTRSGTNDAGSGATYVAYALPEESAGR